MIPFLERPMSGRVPLPERRGWGERSSGEMPQGWAVDLVALRAACSAPAPYLVEVKIDD